MAGATYNTAVLFFLLFSFALTGCKKEFPAINVKVDYYAKDIYISRNGTVIKEIANNVVRLLELYPELDAMVNFDIDSTSRVIYINNFAKELLGVSLDNGAVLYKFDLMRDSVVSDEFYVQKYRDKVLLGTEMDLLVFNKKLQLQKRMLDSVALKNPIIPKGFIGNFKYSLAGDSVKLIYSIKSYLYGFNNLNDSVTVEEFVFKL